MKILMLALALLTPTLASAGVATYGSGVYPNTGIVTPEVAHGAMWTESFAMSRTGDLVVCLPPNEHSHRGNTCTTPRGDNGWMPVQQSLPKDKTYVGFRMTNGSYGHRVIEIYYKYAPTAR